MAPRPTLRVNIDVPELDRAVHFYEQALGLRVARRIGPGAVELLGAEVPIYLLEAPAGSSPLPRAKAQRDYARHWTPVHLDFVVTDLTKALERALAAGANVESEVREAPYGRSVFLADPFGHGLCLIEFNARGHDASVVNGEEHKRVDCASRVIDASPETLYRAFVDPSALVRWLPPTGMTGAFETFEPTPGGRYRMTLTYQDATHGSGKSSQNTDVVEGCFAELVPNVRVVQCVDFESDDPAFAGTMTMTWALRQVADGTEVSFTCENVPAGISAEAHAVGLASSLANLAAFVGA